MFEHDRAAAGEVAARRLGLAELEALGQADRGAVRQAGDRVADRLDDGVDDTGDPDVAGARLDVAGEVDVGEDRLVLGRDRRAIDVGDGGRLLLLAAEDLEQRGDLLLGRRGS